MKIMEFRDLIKQLILEALDDRTDKPIRSGTFHGEVWKSTNVPRQTVGWGYNRDQDMRFPIKRKIPSEWFWDMKTNPGKPEWLTREEWDKRWGVAATAQKKLPPGGRESMDAFLARGGRVKKV